MPPNPSATVPGPDWRNVWEELKATLLALLLAVPALLRRMTFRQMLAWLLRILIVFGLFIVYVTVSVHGMMSLPLAGEMLSGRLHKKVSLLCWWMADYLQTRNLTIAHICAVVLLGLCWWSWEQLMGLVVHRRPWTAEDRLTVALCGFLTLVDFAVMCMGLTGGDFSESPMAAVMMAMFWCVSLAVFALAVKKVEGMP